MTMVDAGTDREHAPGKKRVIILGGGFCGTKVARELADDFSVTLIDSKDFFEFTPGILRSIVEPSHAQKLQAPYERIIDHARFVKGTVRDVTSSQVNVDGRAFSFDYLVISLGSSYEAPFKEQDVILSSRAKNLQKAHQRCEEANTLLVIGGGIVGIEMTGELCDHYQDRKITLCHGGNRLMPRLPEKAREYALHVLQKSGVKIILNEYVTEQKDEGFYTRTGNNIPADVAFLCTGIRPNSRALRKHLADILDGQGRVKVDEHLQVRGQAHMFAGGDITDIKEEKLAQSAEQHAEIICKNIRLLEQGQQEKLMAYRPKKRPMVISMGKRQGIFVWGRLVMTGIIPALLKPLVEWKAMWKFRRGADRTKTLRSGKHAGNIT
ncbi:MAG: FAD-dependent oxidoreductase [DPANN group archaeon]|nr:FAD-dependent oxidoreductase [DPANN group archaeon]